MENTLDRSFSITIKDENEMGVKDGNPMEGYSDRLKEHKISRITENCTQKII